jgi:hypothetical protein
MVRSLRCCSLKGVSKPGHFCVFNWHFDKGSSSPYLIKEGKIDDDSQFSILVVQDKTFIKKLRGKALP